jgi:hypothetical protein
LKVKAVVPEVQEDALMNNPFHQADVRRGRARLTRRSVFALAVGIIAVIPVQLSPWAAQCIARGAPDSQKLDTVEAAIDYKRTLTELLVQLEGYLASNTVALEKAKSLRDAGVVTETEVEAHAASVAATTTKIAATKAKLAEVDAAIARLGGTPARTPSSANRTSAVGVQSLDVPFDATVERLAPNYQGHQVTALLPLLKVMDRPKDEFETTEQYSKRVRANLPTGTLALQIQPTYGGATITYNADRQVMSLEVTAEPRDYWYPAVDKYNSRSGQKLYFVRASSYGYADSELSLACRDVPGFGQARYSHLVAWSTEIRLSPDEARTLKPRLRVLFIGKIPAGVPLEELIVHKSAGAEKALAFVLEQLWLYDVATGTIHAKGLFNVAQTSRD